MITIEQFQQVELRVATVTAAEPHPNADRLLVLQVDLGTETRQIVAGIRAHYDPAALVGTQVVVVANLEPAKLRGVESQGMLLAASADGKLVVVRPDGPMPAGATVRCVPLTPVVAEGLARTFGGVPVLAGVDLVVEGGECVALLGANGAGKTTLLRVLATLLRPSGGTLKLFGEDATLRSPAMLRKIGYVGHESACYGDLTAVENLAFYAELYGVGDAGRRIDDLIEWTELGRFAHRPVRTFSRGMMQRVALARALLHRPELLLLDEPFTGLDRAGRKWLVEFLLSFKAGGGALVVATHSFDAGVGVADRVAILSGGRIVLDRPAAELGLEDVRRLYDELALGPGTAS